MILAFVLSMPGIQPSWNGKWSGEGRLYAIVENLGRSQKADRKGKEIIENSPYRHNFDDGWTASIRVSQVDANVARSLRRRSNGFYGYDWMVSSIVHNGEIVVPGADRKTG